MVNHQPLATDNLGRAGFVVPAGPVDVALAGADGKEFETILYTKTHDGFLVAQSPASLAVDELERAQSATTSPRVTYAPVALECEQPFVVLGTNFSGQADSDHLVIDGYDADLYAGSGVCLLATTPKRLHLGPLRDLYVTANGAPSNTVEVDICKLEFCVANKSSEGMLVEQTHPEQARIKIVGTNVPVLVELQNTSPKSLVLSFGNTVLGPQAAFVTPGGEANAVPLTIRSNAAGGTDVDVHMVADAPWSPDDLFAFDADKLRKLVCQLNRAELIRLKRRLIALELNLAEQQAQASAAQVAGSQPPSASDAETQAKPPVDNDRQNAKLRMLSLRQKRTLTMLNARRALFEALGGTDGEYRQAMDDAAGGATLALDGLVKPVVTNPALAASQAVIKPVAKATPAPEEDTAELVASLQQMSKQWRHYPGRAVRPGKLAAPPEPYMPDPSELGPQSLTKQYKDYLKNGKIPAFALPPSANQHHTRSHHHSHKKHNT
jgi:hypothetical protein